MADFWDSVKTTVNNAAEKTAQFAGNLTELTKAKVSLRNEEKALEETYRNIGELYYAYQRCNDNNSAQIASLIIQADDHREAIRVLNQTVADLQRDLK